MNPHSSTSLSEGSSQRHEWKWSFVTPLPLWMQYALLIDMTPLCTVDHTLSASLPIRKTYVVSLCNWTLRTRTPDDTPDPIQVDVLKSRTRSSKLDKLTDEERTHLCSINACFKCRKTGHMARECPTKGS